MTQSIPHLIAIMGTTASGKSDLAEQLATKLQAQLINADAFQVYTKLDIGTNKPLHKHLYHLIDIKEPTQEFGVGEWIQKTIPLLHSAYNQQQNVIVVGGTGLYIRALFEKWNNLHPHPPTQLRQELENTLQQKGLETLYHHLQKLNPLLAAQIDPHNPVRVRRALEKTLDPRHPIQIEIPPFKTVKFGIKTELNQLHQNINQRVYQMVQQGWIQETLSLLSDNVPINAPAMRAIGYQELIQHIQDKLTLQQAIEKIQLTTRQYAKRQRTWLRSEPNLISISSTLNDLLKFL